jgi:hypothetical protein
MSVYVDSISRDDTTDETDFPFEPKGNPYPKRKLNNTSAWSIPSHDDDGNFLPSVESIKNNGVDSDSGIWEIIAEGVPPATYLIFKGFAEENPPDDYFIYNKGRTGKSYLIKFMDFDETFHSRFNIYTIKMTLKNRGEIV